VCPSTKQHGMVFALTSLGTDRTDDDQQTPLFKMCLVKDRNIERAIIRVNYKVPDGSCD